jgi:hypothetical protein
MASHVCLGFHPSISHDKFDGGGIITTVDVALSAYRHIMRKTIVDSLLHPSDSLSCFGGACWHEVPIRQFTKTKQYFLFWVRTTAFFATVQRCSR